MLVVLPAQLQCMHLHAVLVVPDSVPSIVLCAVQVQAAVRPEW